MNKALRGEGKRDDQPKRWPKVNILDTGNFI